MTGCSPCLLSCGQSRRWVGVLVWLCAWVHVFPLVLTKFSVKSYSIRRAIGTAQGVGQQGGLLVVEEDWLKT